MKVWQTSKVTKRKNLPDLVEPMERHFVKNWAEALVKTLPKQEGVSYKHDPVEVEPGNTASYGLGIK